MKIDWNHIESVLDIVLDADPAEWPVLTRQVCGDNQELLREVGELLGRVPDIQNFLQTSVSETLLEKAAGKPDPEPEKDIHRIERYRILRELARGGMGRVFLAERADGQFDQRVALKLLRSNLDSDPVRRRFRAERQILASLNHDNIARLIDGGITGEGRPYIVMEFIDGEPLDQYCDNRELSVNQRLDLFVSICEAVQYAHRKLVVHRDLKPSNIWVTRDGVVKLLDFGIAKVLGHNGQPEGESPLTQTGLLPLTPAYASPEQIRNQEITTASDVYQLGLVLFELLTGSRPYEVSGKSPGEIEQVICEQPPARPGTLLSKTGSPSQHPGAESGLLHISRARNTTPAQLRKQLHGDLETIVMKALRKEPDRRYESAGQLAEDIRRYRSNIPVIARRGTVRYRLGKWFRRHSWAAASGAAILFSLIAGTAVALWQAREATRSAERATIALAETEQALSRAEALQEFLLDLFRSAEPNRPRDQLPTTEEILALGAERAMNEESAPPAERFAMLYNIGRIYRQQNWNEQARPLLEAAVDLAREHREERPKDLALALWQLSVLLIGIQELDQADRLLQEAESLVRFDETYWQIFVNVQTERGWLEYRKANFVEVINISEPLYQQVYDHDEITEATKQLLLSSLVSASAELGDLQGASRYASEMIELTRNSKTMGPESDSYAVALNNSVHLEYYLGRFNMALQRSREAVSLIEQIENPDRPSAIRAAMRSRLAHALLYAGHFDEALDTAEIANTERAQYQGIPPDESEVRFYFRGYFLANMHRWEEAEQALTKARQLFFQPGKEDFWSILTVVECLLVKTLYHQGNQDKAAKILAELEDRQQGRYPDQPHYRAYIHEARAIFHLYANHPELALAEVDSALALEVNYPGRVMHQSDRRILRARILASLDRYLEAGEELDRAELAYLNLELADHPHYSRIEAVRRELLKYTLNSTLR